MTDYNEQPMTTGQWFWTMLIMSVPVVNVIMFIVWALGNGNRSILLQVIWLQNVELLLMLYISTHHLIQVREQNKK